MHPFAQYLLRSTLNGFSQIFLQRHRGCGLLILIVIGLNDPFLLIGALAGLLAGTATAWCCDYARSDIETGLYGYNAALLGLLITHLLGFLYITLLIAAAVGALSSLPQHYLLRGRRERHGLSGFTLPFVLLGWLMLALCAPMEPTGDLPSSAYQLDGWGALEGVLRGIAQIILLSDPFAGLCLFAGLLMANRRAAFWALCGSAIGIYMALLTGAAEHHALAGLAGYNPALAALALSQTHRSPVAPALGIALAIIGRLAFERLGIAPLTMPFILACWAVALAAEINQRQRLCNRPYDQPLVERGS